MMTKLTQLHRRLNRLRRIRRRARLTIGACGFLIAVAWLLLGMFLADWWFRMGRPERIVLMLIAAGLAVWAFRRLTSPWLGHRESELDMALLVERQQRIDSDVVAALEFEWPDAPGWGSVQLEQAVIEQTATVAPKLEIRADIPTERVRNRLSAMVVTGAILGGLIWTFPEYAMTFFNRLMLGARHYPTRTAIEWLTINDGEVNLHWANQEVKSPYGQPVKFALKVTGRLPESGTVRLTSEHGARTAVSLTPEAEDVFRGELGRLVDSAECQVFLGDAWTEPITLVLVPLPSVDVEMEVTPPSYAGTAAERHKDLRQVSVLEGSQVVVRIGADKELKSATLSIDSTAYPMVREGQQLKSGERDWWKLAAEGSPLARVTEPVRYEIQVTDVDGLQLEQPIQGGVLILADTPPQINDWRITTTKVVPTAKPRVEYSASDNFGIGKLSVLAEVIHADGKEEEKPEIVLFDASTGKTPAKELQNEKDFRLLLTPLATAKGDQLRLTLRAVDYRGSGREGRTALSEPVLLEVTDLKGLMDAQTEGLREAGDRMKIMTDLQIGVGEGK